MNNNILQKWKKMHMFINYFLAKTVVTLTQMSLQIRNNHPPLSLLKFHQIDLILTM